MRGCNSEKNVSNWLAFILILMALTYILVFWNPPTTVKTVVNLQNVRISAHIKDLKENDDGTVDVILRIDEKLKNIKMFRKNVSVGSQVSIHGKRDGVSIEAGPEETKPERKGVLFKTEYPLTLDTPYVINNKDICSGIKNLTFLIIVHTAPDHFQRRRNLRETWANKNVFKTITMRIVFLFGLASNRKTQILIENESTVYKDMVQGNFKDTYKNLTHKGVLGFRWISEHCKSSQLVIKVDDDVFVNIFKVIDDFLPTYGKKPKQILCHLRPAGTSPVLHGDTKLKWGVGEDDFRGQKFYPTYCNGYAVFMTPDLIMGMYRAAYLTPFFWVDDVYLFGLLPKKVGAHWENVVKNFTLNQKVCLEAYESSAPTKLTVCTAWQDNVMERLWFSALSRMSPSNRLLVNDDLLAAVDEMVIKKKEREEADAIKKKKETEKAKNNKPIDEKNGDKKPNDKANAPKPNNMVEDKKTNNNKIDGKIANDKKVGDNKPEGKNVHQKPANGKPQNDQKKT